MPFNVTTPFFTVTSKPAPLTSGSVASLRDQQRNDQSEDEQKGKGTHIVSF
jgi:hypothetical protein